MCPFLFAAAVDTVVAPYYDKAYLHEWGVAMYAESTVSVVSQPQESLLAPWPAGPVCVDAPVIYLYGGEFDFDLTVRVPGGAVTGAWPAPDGSVEMNLPMVDSRQSAISWSGMRTSCPYTTDRTSSAGEDDELVPSVVDVYGGIWRSVESLVLTRPEDGFRDSFLFYECELEPGALPMPLPRPGVDAGDVVYDGPVLVFSKLANGPGVGIYLTHAADAWLVPPSVTRMRVLTLDEAFDVFHGWAAGDGAAEAGLKEPEIQAMWDTWAPFFEGGDWHGSSLIVFPLPGALVDRISTLVLTTEPEYEVHYSRFFLGVVQNG